ncbi:MAG: radical SAM family heme chaperone HemW [Alphaproteobacteria bacterium]
MIAAEDFKLGLYVHWPFCQKRCPYCDFNVHEVGADDPTDHQRWADALVRELQHFAPLAQGRKLTSVFFGGGTPSLMRPETVHAVIEAAQREIGFRNDIEITLEANPTSTDADRFAGYRDAGVNRLSLGVQSLRDQALLALGRQHSVEEALMALEIARSAFDNISFDLMYARPRQSFEDWQDELAQALALQPHHISLYQLTIEPNTLFEQLTRKGVIQPKSEDDTADFYLATRQILSDAGYHGYEVSNHAPEPHFESQHNRLYWAYQDYIGIGPGAHGRLTKGGAKWATRQHRAPSVWLDHVESDAGHATVTNDALTAEDQLAEALPFGLRLSEGMPLRHYEVLANKPLNAGLLQKLESEGLLTTNNNILKVTDEGRPVIDALARYLQS